MKSLKLRVIISAFIAGMMSTAMASSTPPYPTPSLDQFTSGMGSCENVSYNVANGIFNSGDMAYMPYFTLFSGTFDHSTYSWNVSCVGSACTGTTAINCVSLNPTNYPYPQGLPTLISSSAQGYMQNLLNAYSNGASIPAGKQVQCQYTNNNGNAVNATCVIK